MDEERLKESLKRDCENAGVKDGYLLLYLTDGKIQLVGTLDPSALLGPFMKYLVNKRGQ